MTVIKAGTISVDANSTSVTGSGTNWLLTVSSGDMLKVGQGFEIIESVESNTQLTLAAPWSYDTVVDGSYYISQMGVNHDTITTNRLLREYTEKLKSGTLFKPEASGTLAERADYDDEGKGFFYLQADIVPNLVFTKLSDASGDWNAGTDWPAKGDVAVVTENGSNGNFDVGGALTEQGQQVWHSGNDGAGSGLDADTLDGFHANQFIALNSARPSFYAVGSGEAFNPAALTALLFPNVIRNVGSGYDPVTGRFTAPVDGNYFFGAHIFSLSSSAERYSFGKNDNWILTDGYICSSPIASNAYSGCRTQYLNAGDFVDVRGQYGTGSIFQWCCAFFGHLIV